MNRTSFFEAAREGVFAGKLKQSQVGGLDAILDEAEKRGTPIHHVAYILATTHHETGARMQPIKELGGNKYLAKYDTGRLAKILGNTPQADGDGQKFAGRGFVQITGRTNYRKFGIETAPDKALEMPTAIMILFNGMTKGMFTGKKLADFITDAKADYYGARAIVNGDKRKNGAKIAVTAKAFEKALRLAGYNGVPFPDYPLEPKRTKPEPKLEPKAGIAALVAAALLAVGAWFASLPCSIFGVLCQ